MMEVLGLTDAVEERADPRLSRVGDLAMVLLPGDRRRLPRQRMRRQMDCAAAFPSFLPFAPAASVERHEVERWLAPRMKEVVLCLERIRNRVQVTIHVDAAAARPSPRPADWLRQRAAALRDRREALNVLRERATGLGAIDAAATAEADRLHLLCDRSGLEVLVAGLCEAAGTPARLHVRAQVSGPWPVFAFGPGRCAA